MDDLLLINTDILIDYLRGQEDAIVYLNNLTEPLLISAITQAELYAGVREGTERRTLDIFVSIFECVNVNSEIARLGGLFRRDYGKSRGVGLADALIAATAESRYAILVTLNRKHFPMLDRIVVPYLK